jgi:hypothetical protein
MSRTSILLTEKNLYPKIQKRYCHRFVLVYPSAIALKLNFI